jgi:tetratricopeptide (TPR) repeat protein
MKTGTNSPEIKRLRRLLDTLNGFELVICGCHSLAVCKKMRELIRSTCREKHIEVIDIDISGLAQAGGFIERLLENTKTGNRYHVFNIVGLNRHVKASQPSSFLKSINLMRERLAAEIPGGLFFWLPENLIQRFTLDAPDLWAWRNTVLVFKDDKREMTIELIPIKSYIEENFENFTRKEKQSQQDHLNSLMVYVRKKPPTPAQQKRLAEIYADLGKLFYSMKEYPVARIYYEKSLHLRTKIGDMEGTASIYNNMGMAYQAERDDGRALDCYGKSLDILEELKDRGKMAAIYNNIGIIYQNSGQYDRAHDRYRQSRDVFLHLGEKRGMAITLNNLGSLHALRRSYHEALEVFQQGLALFKELMDRFHASITLHNMCHVYYTYGDYDAAIDHLKQSLIGLDDKTRYIYSLLELSNLYMEADRKDEGIGCRRRAYILTKRSKDPNISSIWDNFKFIE